MSLNNLLALVTGGASGIGAAVCQLFSAEGARVIVVDVDRNGIEETLRKLKGENKHYSCVVDVSNAAEVDKLANKIQACYNGEVPSIVVHCAGIVRNFGGLNGCTEAIWDQIIAVNLKGTYLINRKFALLMQQQQIKNGSIVNISSVCRHGIGVAPEYAASKAGQIGWSKSLAKELAPIGIRVNAIAPGAIDTPLNRNSGVSTPESDEACSRTNLPMGRMGTADEVAQVCLFLASGRSSYVTGSVYDVHGCLERGK